MKFFYFRIQQNISPPSLKRRFIGSYTLKPGDHAINVLQWNILAQGIQFLKEKDNNFFSSHIFFSIIIS